MEEIWTLIDDFPRYRVSNLGRIVNAYTGRYMVLTKTRTGCLKVGLWKEESQHVKSVKILVATAFVEGRIFDRDAPFDTPIQLDGNQDNCRADNLMWRPRWFAWKYTNQFTNNTNNFRNHRRGPVVDVKSGARYSNVYEAATINGLLFKDVWQSILFKEPVFPTWQEFEKLE